ncbi:MAG: hypothetical protein K2P13_02535 [Lachnospiraceae bacterium]|nr:hypothetical protein [Lachnospiraceae bacterium]
MGNKKFVPENIIRDFKLNSESGVTMRFAKSLFQTIMKYDGKDGYAVSGMAGDDSSVRKR